MGQGRLPLTYYPYDIRSHRTDFTHETGQLLPMEKLQIRDVVTDVTPGSPDQRQIMAVSRKTARTMPFPLGQ